MQKQREKQKEKQNDLITLLTESVELECSVRTTRKTDGLNQISEDNHSMHNIS